MRGIDFHKTEDGIPISFDPHPMKSPVPMGAVRFLQNGGSVRAYIYGLNSTSFLYVGNEFSQNRGSISPATMGSEGIFMKRRLEPGFHAAL
jgi:hypothetical protein